MAFNAANVYQNNKILTASPTELTLMLYDGAIKFCNIAIQSIDDNNVINAHDNIIKTEKIIVELRSTLNKNYAVAEDFENIYTYIYDRLVYANIKKDKEVLEEVLEHLRGIRDTWKEVMKKGKAC